MATDTLQKRYKRQIAQILDLLPTDRYNRVQIHVAIDRYMLVTLSGPGDTTAELLPVQALKMLDGEKEQLDEWQRVLDDWDKAGGDDATKA